MIDNLFTYSTPGSVTPAGETALVVAAQSGDTDAYMMLLDLYGPTLRATVARAKKTVDSEEAQAVALLAFAEVLASHDTTDPAYANGRLASRLTPHLKDALGVAMTAEHAFAVPKRTYMRYLGILNEADGNVQAARDLAPDRQMTVETFDAIRDALGTGTIDDLPEGQSAAHDRIEGATTVYASSPVTDVEDQVLVDAALASITDEECRIVELAYGFTEYDPVPDAEIGHRLGLTRPTVQRKRAGALSTIRKTLGVSHA